MSLIVLHTRWNAGSAERFRAVRDGLEGQHRRPAGCYSQQLRQTGTALFGTEVWLTKSEARRSSDGLVAQMRGAGLGEPTHALAFAVPAVFAAAYLRAGRSPGYILALLDSRDSDALLQPAPAAAPPVEGSPELDEVLTSVLPRPRRPVPAARSHI